jgi:tRNA threonylcarbamoyladenosine biosynthesis protein TsaB
MAFFLAIHTRYHHVELGLFKDRQVIEAVHDDNKRISKYLILMIQDLLNKHTIGLEELAFVAVNQGPAPFTTLRVVLASVNGLSFATQVPLIGVDSLYALAQEYSNYEYKNIIALLNAFSQDVYYAIVDKKSGTLQKGYENSETFLHKTAKSIGNQPVLFIGNGVELYKNLILTYFLENAHFLDPNPEVASLNSIAYDALATWHLQHEKVFELMPLYLKGYAAPLATCITTE